MPFSFLLNNNYRRKNSDWSKKYSKEIIKESIKNLVFLNNSKGPFIESKTYEELLQTITSILYGLKFFEKEDSSILDGKINELNNLISEYRKLVDRSGMYHFIRNLEFDSKNAQDIQIKSDLNSSQEEKLISDFASFQIKLDDFILNIENLIIEKYSYIIHTENEDYIDTNSTIYQQINLLEKKSSTYVKKTTKKKKEIADKLYVLLKNNGIRKIPMKKAYQLITEMIGKAQILDNSEMLQNIDKYDNSYYVEMNGKRYVILSGLSSIESDEDSCLIISNNQCISISYDTFLMELNKLKYDKNNAYKFLMRVPLTEKPLRYIYMKSLRSKREIDYYIKEKGDGEVILCREDDKEMFMMLYNSVNDINLCEIPRAILVRDRENVQTLFYIDSDNKKYTKSERKNQSPYKIKEKVYSYEEAIKKCRWFISSFNSTYYTINLNLNCATKNSVKNFIFLLNFFS